MSAAAGAGDLACIDHVELNSVAPAATARLLIEVLGMRPDARMAGGGLRLRGADAQHRFTVAVVGAERPGLGQLGLRAVGPASLRRRARALAAAPTDGPVYPYRFTDPTGHAMRLALGRGPSPATAPSAAGEWHVPARRIDHVALLSRDVADDRRFVQERLGYRLHEHVVDHRGRELEAWLSLSIAVQELVYRYTREATAEALDHVAFAVDSATDVETAAEVLDEAGLEIEVPPRWDAVLHTTYLHVREPGGNRIEICCGGNRVYDPAAAPVAWTPAQRRRALSG